MNKTETVVLGGGCFWCTETVFKMLKGVVNVVPGYAGGDPAHPPTYDEVARGMTDYAEVIQIEYDPSAVTFTDLLTIFFGSHDPTTLNRQGYDVGTQYRSVIFYTTEEQKAESYAFIKELNESNEKGAPIVTEVSPLDKFYNAESYHLDYYAKNQGNMYCELVINPKLQKVQEKYAELLKTHN